MSLSLSQSSNKSSHQIASTNIRASKQTTHHLQQYHSSFQQPTRLTCLAISQADAVPATRKNSSVSLCSFSAWKDLCSPVSHNRILPCERHFDSHIQYRVRSSW